MNLNLFDFYVAIERKREKNEIVSNAKNQCQISFEPKWATIRNDVTCVGYVDAAASIAPLSYRKQYTNHFIYPINPFNYAIKIITKKKNRKKNTGIYSNR